MLGGEPKGRADKIARGAVPAAHLRPLSAGSIGDKKLYENMFRYFTNR